MVLHEHKDRFTVKNIRYEVHDTLGAMWIEQSHCEEIICLVIIWFTEVLRSWRRLVYRSVAELAQIRFSIKLG